MQETQELGFDPLCQEDPLEKGTATLQYSYLENPVDRAAWRAIVHRFARGWTLLKQAHRHQNKQHQQKSYKVL